MAQMVKPLPAMRETWVQSLGHEDPLEKEMATHSSTHAWRGLVGCSPWGCTKSGTTEQLLTSQQQQQYVFDDNTLE